MAPENQAQVIVICSPNRAIARLAEVNLRRSGAQTVVVRKGSDAIDAVLRTQADVLYLDRATSDPGPTGVMRTLRLDPRTARVRIEMVDTKAALPKLGPSDFLGRLFRPLVA
jgi:CheY-like chemotaxis protein